MSALRYSNDPHPGGRFPSYYANNRQYPGSYAQNETPGRTSRRIHDGFSLTRNYGLDTTSDDINSSPYSSPYYVNGRYNSDNLTTQRGSSASVQGIQRLADVHTRKEDFGETDIQTTLEMWQGKQIKFELPYSGRIVGNTLTLRNTGGSTGNLSIYFSTEENGSPIYEAAVSLCDISQDRFEHIELRSITTVPMTASPRKKIFVRMEIWGEIEACPVKKTDNPFNTGRKIEIAATGKGNHAACEYKLGSKNKMVSEAFNYKAFPSRPLIGLVYNDYESVPVDRLDNIKTGASVSLNGYRYDIMCCKKGGAAEVLIYDKEMDRFVPNKISVDGRVTQLNIAQVTDVAKRTWVYYVDGYSPLQRFRIGEWESMHFEPGSADKVVASINDATWFNSDLGETSGTYIFEFTGGKWYYNQEEKQLSTYGLSLSGGGASEGATITVIYTVTEGGNKFIESVQYVDARPVIGAKLIMFHNNRLYLAGFRGDPNLIQISSIEKDGPDFTQFPYRLYTPNRSPYDTSLNPITSMAEYTSDEIMIAFKNGFSRFQTNVNIEDGTPQQVSGYMDSAGVQAQGDLVNYKGALYSYDVKEGIRQFNGALWRKLPTTVDSHYDRVDMSKPRKLWGYSNKLYFNYTDVIDGKAKCLLWDSEMNYQQYPWFQDVGIPFCDVRFDESEDLIGIHPDYPCVMRLYAEDTWSRFDSPIVFERHTKYLSLPGNAADIIVQRCHAKVLANANRWWWLSVNADKPYLTQRRGDDKIFRQPCWATIETPEPPELPFSQEDIYEEDAIARLSLPPLRIFCSSVQLKVQTKTLKHQASLISVLFEVQPRNFL